MTLPLEKEIQSTCTQFLELDGWRSLRTDPVSDRSRGKGFGELGMADHLYVRYRARKRAALNAGAQFWYDPQVEFFWVEWKRERGGKGKRALFTKAEKAKIHQKAWHAAERARGALTLIAGEEFPASIEGFTAWYASSGLQRKQITLGPRPKNAQVAHR